MKTCSKCGKRGLFLKLDSEKRCKACASFEARQAEKNRLHQASIDAYNAKLNAIPEIQWQLSKEKAKRLKVSDMPEIKISNITARSNKDMLGNFVVIDVETTGLNVGNDKIIEFAAIKYDLWKPVACLHSLINPLKPIPKNASDINHITDDMVATAPECYQLFPSILEFIGNNSLVGHNISFDLKFLYKNGLDLITSTRKYYDTLELARKYLKTPENSRDEDNFNYDVLDYKLDTLCDYYSIRDDSTGHRALSDCYATAKLFDFLVSEKL